MPNPSTIAMEEEEGTRGEEFSVALIPFVSKVGDFCWQWTLSQIDEFENYTILIEKGSSISKFGALHNAKVAARDYKKRENFLDQEIETHQFDVTEASLSAKEEQR